MAPRGSNCLRLVRGSGRCDKSSGVRFGTNTRGLLRLGNCLMFGLSYCDHLLYSACLFGEQIAVTEVTLSIVGLLGFCSLCYG